MFKALKKLFTAEEEETEVQKAEENETISAENSSEESSNEEPEEEEIVIFPESDLKVEAPIDEEVLELTKALFDKSQNGDGTFTDKYNYLHYSKDYEFCTLDWIIVDTRIEEREDIKKSFQKAVEKFYDIRKREIDMEYLIWCINPEPVSSPLRLTKKNSSLLKFNSEIYNYFINEESPPKNPPNNIFFDKLGLFQFTANNDTYFEVLDQISKYRAFAISLVNFKSQDELLYHRFYNQYSTQKDPFTNKTIFKWDSIGTPSNEYLNLIQVQLDKGFEPRTHITLDHWLYFKLKNVNGVDFITFEFRIKEMKLRADDSIFFLLSNGEVIEFRLPKKFYTIEPRVLKGVDVPITQEELITLSKHEVEKVRIHEKKSNFKVDIDISDYINQWDMYKDYRQYVIRNLFADHLEQVEKIIDGYKPLVGDEKTVDEQNNEPCHVYLMKDQANDFFKIGISNKPNYRERTLQSEKPTIDLIASKEFPSRTIAESIERALHDSYSDKRLRGEWFDLDPKDIKDIKTTLK
jgi:hypothetical protein